MDIVISDLPSWGPSMEWVILVLGAVPGAAICAHAYRMRSRLDILRGLQGEEVVLLAGRLWGRGVATVYQVRGTVQAVEGNVFTPRLRLDPWYEVTPREGKRIDVTREGYLARLQRGGVLHC
jgi:hypothetical protein